MTSARGILGLAAVLIAVAAVAVVAMGGYRLFENPRPLALEALASFDSPANPADAASRAFVVKQGETTGDIAERLQSAQLIQQALLFRWLADLKGVGSSLAAGEYDLSASMKPSQILATLAEGKTRPAPMVTIPEGWRSEEIAERLAAKGVATADQFLGVVRSGQSSLSGLSSRPPGSSLEGYLFPDSYQFSARSTADSAAARMVEQFDQQFTPKMREQAAALLLSVHQIVTMASIIEREAVVPSERPLMAGVFYNRLKEGMKLQTDPTVQYAVATSQPDSVKQYGWWKTNLTADDLKIDSPYNTYLYAGLPPGPICNPGLASLRAALEPAQTDYLYFVAKPDGSHAFARTLEEHNANVARYGR